MELTAWLEACWLLAMAIRWQIELLCGWELGDWLP
jgi:hypothetical protein